MAESSLGTADLTAIYLALELLCPGLCRTLGAGGRLGGNSSSRAFDRLSDVGASDGDLSRPALSIAGFDTRSCPALGLTSFIPRLSRDC
jgi:hypothetical protein